EIHYLGILLHRVGARLGHIDLDGMTHQRRGDDEDHQQHQHHVDERHHVDFRHRTAAALVVETAECHHSSPEAAATGAMRRTLPCPLRWSLTCWPVVRKVNRSWAKASS